MVHDYGYIKGTTGSDDDHVDVFIGPHLDSELVFVVNQVDPATGDFDEHKCLFGFTNEAAAIEGYLANYEEGWTGLGDIKPLTLDDFKEWLASGDLTKAASLPPIHIDRPKGYKKTFQTQQGPVDLLYPLDYGYFEGIINPQDNEEADVFVGSGGNRHGRYMKGTDLTGEWQPDEYKWYTGLTDDEHKAMMDWWGEQNADLVRDDTPFENPESLLADLLGLTKQSSPVLQRALSAQLASPTWNKNDDIFSNLFNNVSQIRERGQQMIQHRHNANALAVHQNPDLGYEQLRGIFAGEESPGLEDPLDQLVFGEPG